MERDERPDIDILEKWVKNMKKLYNIEDFRTSDDEITEKIGIISRYQEIVHAKVTA